MKKLGFILSITLAFSCLEASAQILIGPVIGGHMTWATFDDKSNKDVYKVKPVFNLNVGACVSFRVRKRFFLQTSFLYSVKTKSLTEKSSHIPYDGDFSNDLKLKYLEMPILYTAEFKGKLNKKSIKEFKWYIGVGPTVSYWLGGKGELADGDLLENDPDHNPLPYKITFGKNRADVKRGEMNVDEANRIQLGLNVSTGLILEPVGFNKIVVALRYEFGHSFLSRGTDGYFGGYDGDLYYVDELQVRMHTLNLSLHYFIDLKTDQRKKGKSTSKVKKGKSKN